MISHRAVAAVVPELIEAYSIRPHDRVLHCAPLGFDTSISEILRGLCAGACLCIAPADVTASPDFFYRLRFLAEERVTRAVLPAALLHSAQPAPLDDLEVLVTTGEASTKELVDRWAPGRTGRSAPVRAARRARPRASSRRRRSGGRSSSHTSSWPRRRRNRRLTARSRPRSRTSCAACCRTMRCRATSASGTRCR